MSEQHTYAGNTLAGIKAAAEASLRQSDAIGESEWYDAKVFSQIDPIGHDAAYIATTTPSTVLAMAARIEELDAELHRVTTEPPTGTAPCARLCEHTAFKSRHEQDQRGIAEREQQLAAALRLVAEVRFACGDDGKRMQDELVQYVGELAKDAARIGMLESNSSIEVGYESDDGDMVRVVHEVTGSRNDRQWKEIGRGYTLRAAIDAAMEQTKSRERA